MPGNSDIVKYRTIDTINDYLFKSRWYREKSPRYDQPLLDEVSVSRVRVWLFSTEMLGYQRHLLPGPRDISQHTNRRPQLFTVVLRRTQPLGPLSRIYSLFETSIELALQVGAISAPLTPRTAFSYHPCYCSYELRFLVLRMKVAVQSIQCGWKNLTRYKPLSESVSVDKYNCY